MPRTEPPTSGATVVPLRRRAGWTLALTGALALLAACSGGGGGLPGTAGNSHTSDTSAGSVGAGGTSGFTAPPTTAAGQAVLISTKPSQFKVRFFNDLTSDGAPGPAVDIYDQLVPSTTATSLPKGVRPLVRGLRFGQFSDYVVPRQVTEAGDSGEVQLSALVSGSPPGPENQLVSAGGLTAGTSPPQMTSILKASGTALTHGLSGAEYGEVVEKKGGQQGAPPSTAPAGKGVFVLELGEVPSGALDSGGTYFFVDQSCTPPVNGDGVRGVPDVFSSGASADKDGPFPFFVTAPGRHDLDLVFRSSNVTPTCADIRPTTHQATVTIDAGEDLLTIPYGVDAQHIKIATARIDQ